MLRMDLLFKLCDNSYCFEDDDLNINCIDFLNIEMYTLQFELKNYVTSMILSPDRSYIASR